MNLSLLSYIFMVPNSQKLRWYVSAVLLEWGINPYFRISADGPFANLAYFCSTSPAVRKGKISVHLKFRFKGEFNGNIKKKKAKWQQQDKIECKLRRKNRRTVCHSQMQSFHDKIALLPELSARIFEDRPYQQQINCVMQGTELPLSRFRWVRLETVNIYPRQWLRTIGSWIEVTR